QPTPAEEFAAYDIEELRQFLRLALTNAAAVPSSPDRPTQIDTRLRVPTRFRVPVQGQLRWEQVPGWQVKREPIPFQLQPSEALEIPLQAEIAAGTYPRSPALTIAFAAGRFRNRTITIHPFKLAGPDLVRAARASVAPTVDGRLDEEAWKAPNPGAGAAGPYALLGLPPKGGRGDTIRFLADDQALYIGARLEDPHQEV